MRQKNKLPTSYPGVVIFIIYGQKQALATDDLHFKNLDGVYFGFYILHLLNYCM